MKQPVHVWQDNLPQGTLYWPGNDAARALAEQIDFPYFEAATLDHFRKAGFEVVVLSRPTPIPHPWAGLVRGTA